MDQIMKTEEKNNISRCSILFKKLDKWIDEIENNDFHNTILTMTSCALVGRIINLHQNEEKIEAYFDYSPEVFEIIKEYEPKKLLKFLERIQKNWLKA